MQQYSYYKDIQNLIDIFGYNLTDIVNIVEFIVFNLFDKKGIINIALDILIYYKLDIDIVDILLKVCKINSLYKTLFTCKKKTALKKLFEKRKTELLNKN